MRRFLCILLTVTMLLGCTGLEFVSAAASLTTKDGFLDVEAEDLSFDKSYLEKTQKNKLYSNSYGLSVKSEDKTEPAASDRRILTFRLQPTRRVHTRFGCGILRK